jgi:hypothetical protein
MDHRYRPAGPQDLPSLWTSIQSTSRGLCRRSMVDCTRSALWWSGYWQLRASVRSLSSVPSSLTRFEHHLHQTAHKTRTLNRLESPRVAVVQRMRWSWLPPSPLSGNQQEVEVETSTVPDTQPMLNLLSDSRRRYQAQRRTGWRCCSLATLAL